MVSSIDNSQRITRLAPSPTGALHLGNIRTFLINWVIARQHGWNVVMRIEDLDGPRVKPGVEAKVLDTLSWIGLDWDSPILRQSDNLSPYSEAMKSLCANGFAYPCDLTRAQIEGAASAPHERDNIHVVPFTQSLRPETKPSEFTDRETNWRYVLNDDSISFQDTLAGSQQFNIATASGDFVIWSKREQPAYQLAVVVDDERQQVTDIIRGDDLLLSTARQISLRRALSLYREEAMIEPIYWHLPLVYGDDGRRLAKRHGDTRLQSYQKSGVPVERIIGLIAVWSGVTQVRQTLSLDELVSAFDITGLPNQQIVFTQEDHQWLLGK